MAVSISQAQARFLNRGGLDNIGDNRSNYDGMVLDASMEAIFDVAGYLVKEATDNLNSSGHVSSGRLSDSFKVLNPEITGKKIHLDIEALDYYDYLNKGVKGTKSGSGKYAFKNDYPNKYMMQDIRKWLIRKGLRQRRDVEYMNRTGQRTVSETSNKIAYAIARSIKQKGIKGTGFFDKAMKSANQYSRSVLGKALKIDVINSLPTSINGTNT